MKTLIAAIFLAASAAFADRLVADRADHSILVTIESDPPGAELYSIPASTNEEAVKIGQTPHVALVELRWGKGLFVKKWRKMTVKTIGNICSLEYDKKEKRYDLSMKFNATAKDYQDRLVEDPLASFASYDDLDFDNLKGIPRKATIHVTLDPVSSGTAPPATKSAPATVMMAAEGEKGKFGTLTLNANVPGAEVIVDGKPAGFTPVRLILSEGDHDVVVQKAGHRMYQSQVSISAESEMSLKVKLDPAN